MTGRDNFDFYCYYQSLKTKLFCLKNPLKVAKSQFSKKLSVKDARHLTGTSGLMTMRTKNRTRNKNSVLCHLSLKRIRKIIIIEHNIQYGNSALNEIFM